MSNREIIDWLLAGDISICYQTYKDLLGDDKYNLQENIHKQGWAKKILGKQRSDGHWGMGYYQPKWISTHYTLLDLRNLFVIRGIPSVNKVIDDVLDELKAADGGINPSKGSLNSDVCINGMALNFCSYFGAGENKLKSVVDFILSQSLDDGGYNCQLNRSGAVHSSLHSTLSVLEGFREFIAKGYSYRVDEIERAEEKGQEFILQHKLFRSDRTGKIIKNSFLRFPYPPRWYYDILRCLDYFRYAEHRFDTRMEEATDILLGRQKVNGRWNQYAKYPGKVHFIMEHAGKPGRWNTLRALRVISWFQNN